MDTCSVLLNLLLLEYLHRLYLNQIFNPLNSSGVNHVGVFGRTLVHTHFGQSIRIGVRKNNCWITLLLDCHLRLLSLVSEALLEHGG